MAPEVIARLKKHSDFQEFVSWALGEIDSLDTVDGLEEMTDSQAGQEGKVRLKTKQALYELLRPFIEKQREPFDPTPDQIQEVKDRTGL